MPLLTGYVFHVTYIGLGATRGYMKELLQILLTLTLLGCSPKVITKSFDHAKSSRSHLYYEPFAFIESDTIDKSQWMAIGKIEIRDGGLTLNCDYETIKKLAKEKALKLGGNGLQITEHRKPDLWSTCHRIKADVLWLPNPRMYEDEVLWHPDRQLEISDFKGSVEKRPFTAGTLSSFRYRIDGIPAFPKKYKIYVETYFDCHLSYFKRTAVDSLVLAHEQVHFDISELYARKFIERIEKEHLDLNQFLAKQEEILKVLGRELQLKQDEYDSEVYVDRTKQQKWNDWIVAELEKYQRYADKVLNVEVD